MAQKRTRSGSRPPVIPIGAPARSELEFAVQLQVKDPKKSFRLELPGDIVQVGSRFLAGIIPVGVIALGGEGKSPRRSAVLHFAEQDRAGTDEALSELGEATKRKAPQEYKILVEAESISFGDIIEAAQKNQFGRHAPASVQMRVSLRLEGRKSPLVSKPFKGLMVVLADRGPSGNADDNDEGSHLFDCHSHWYTMLWPFGRYTLCHGPCPAGSGPCGCGTPPAQWCKGWCWCWC